MRNYVAKLKENSKKGFSLVELIIVIAIMAILVGIVASQVIPYMEKSRKSKDQQQLSNVNTAVVSAVSQADTEVGNVAHVQLGSLNSDTEGAKFAGDLADLLESGKTAADLATIESSISAKFKSKAFKKDTSIYVTYAGDSATGLATQKGQAVTSVSAATTISDKNMEAISE